MAGPFPLRISSSMQLILAQSTYPAEATGFNFSGTYATSLVQKTLAEPISVQCSTCSKHYSFRADPNDWKVELDVDALSSTKENKSFGSSAKYVHSHGILITTPGISNIHAQPSKTHDAEHTHSIGRKVEITAVLTHLQTRLGSLSLDSKHWLFSSENCRVTTSISNPNGGFPLSTAKKVAFIKTAWLRLFDSMSEPQCISIETFFNDHLGVYLDDWLMKIKRAPGFSSLTVLLRGIKNAGVLDIQSGSGDAGPRCARQADRHDMKQVLDIAKVSSCESLQFSQQASTLDPKQILAWMDVCEKIVLRAHGAEGTYFAWQFSPEGEFRAPSFGVRDMLKELGVKSSTASYFENRYVKDTADLDAQLALALNSVMNTLGPLALYKANAALRGSQQTAIREKVLAKMKSGAYGRMHEKFIEVVHSSK